jgi:hypothetical protein
MVRRRWQVTSGPITAREAQRTRVDLGLSPLEENPAKANDLLELESGGTGAGSASEARTNLGLGTMATQNANAVAITGGSIAVASFQPDLLRLRPLSSDPSDPDDGHSVMWLSDGTGSGDAGDLMVKIKIGATTKTITLIDWSAS